MRAKALAPAILATELLSSTRAKALAPAILASVPHPSRAAIVSQRLTHTVMTLPVTVWTGFFKIEFILGLLRVVQRLPHCTQLRDHFFVCNFGVVLLVFKRLDL
jgi:hypothetical protein